MRDWILSFLIFAFSIIFLTFPQVKAYDDNGSYFTCYNCIDCINALNNNTHNEVRLGANISDYSGTCIADPENFSNKIFDCQGYAIDGNKTGTIYGISLIGKTNNTIRNCTITEFQYGIYLRDSSNNNTIANSIIMNNTDTGIYLDHSSNNILINNTINNHNSGILIASGNNTVINNNTLINNYYGINMDHSSNNLLRNNIMNNDYNLRIYGGEISHFYQDIDTSNLVNGKPIYYWTNEKSAPNNCKNAEINESNNAGFVALVSCDNITVKNLNLSKNYYGILLVNTSNSRILNSTLNDNEGIYLFLSQNNTLTNITANNNKYGIVLEFSSGNLLADNEIRNITDGYGISVYDSINCNILNNLIENVSDYAIYFNNVNFSRIENNDIFNTAGISIDDSISNTITSNRIINSTYDGIVPSGTQNNTITYNYIENVDYYGIELTGMATGEYVAHNIIKNASRGISLDQQTSNNTVLNNTISESDYGIYLYFNSANNILTNNTINDTSTGIYLNLASNNTIDSNNIKNVTTGIFLDLDLGIGNNFVLSNKILDYKRGIIVYLGSGNNISNNFLYHGGNGIILNSSNNNVLISNVVNWTYWDAGIYLYFSNGSMLMNNMVNGSEGYGIWVSYANNNNLTSNTLPYNQYGIYIYYSNNTFILNNNVSSNTENGMQIEYSNSNTISNNIVNSNGYNGIHLYHSHNNTILNNTLSFNGGNGIGLTSSNSTHIVNNIAKDNVECDFYSDTNSLDNVVINLDVGSTIVSFESKDIALKKALSPGGEPLGNIGKYVNVTNTSADSWFYLNISYNDSELGNVIESTLKMWKYNGSWYQLSESYVDTSSNLVYSSNTTEFGIFSPLGQVSSGTSRTGGGGIGGGESINIPSVSSACGDGKCDLNQENYLTCPNDCKAPEEAPKNISIDLGDIRSGKNLEGSFTETFKFKVNEEEHIVQIGKITNNSVTLWIWSSPIRVTLNIGETKEFDLDSNGIAELEISLTQIKNGKVFLFFKEIEEEKPTNIPEEEKEVSKEEKTPATPSEEIKKPSLWPSVGFFIYNISQNLIPILLLLTILIITTIYFFIHKRKSTKK